ncbi:MAG: transposase [Candidatus Berkiella sp.]
MTIPRSQQIDLSKTSYYHCMTRCVRRSYLCGYDSETQRDYSHRKEWIVSKIKHLANIFAIHICAYAIMSNHYHLVLFVNEKQADSWDQQDIITRWHALFPTDAKSITTYSKKEAEIKIEQWRHRLMDISWFMRCLNEPIARYSNKEDEKKGRFWEGRFKSQALLDEGALLSAMVYVDLNPIRSQIAQTPEESDFTSIQERLKTFAKHLKNQSASLAPQPQSLVPFADLHIADDINPIIDFKLLDYFELVESTGRMIHQDKKGIIPNDLAPLLLRLGLDAKYWLQSVKHLQTRFSYAIGHNDLLASFKSAYSHHSPKGTHAANQFYL